MSRPKKCALLVFISVALAGCGTQDNNQPPENSISASPKNDLPLVKAKKSNSALPARKTH